MDDAESPQDAENGKADQTRRASLRLRDAEAVATTRRDMFGDGSLLDALAGGPPTPEQGPSPTDAPPAPPADAPPLDAEPADAPSADMQPEDAQTEDAQPEDTQSTDAGAAAGHRDSDGDPGAPDAGLPTSFADQPQSLDAIIDSFPAEVPNPEGNDPERPGPMLPPLFTGSDRDTEAGGQASVSAIFDAIGSREEEVQPGATTLAPEPLGSDMPGNDASALGQWDVGGDGSRDDAMQADSAQDTVSSGAPVEPSAWPPYPEPPGADAALPEPSVVAPFTEADATDADAPQQAEPGALPPFSEPPPAAAGVSIGWPPFPEPPGAETGLASSEGSVPPPFIELPAEAEADVPHYTEPNPPPAAAEAPVYPEPPRAGDFPEVPGMADHAPSYLDPPGAPPFPEYGEPPMSGDVEATAHRHALDGVASLSGRATAKIAAEASATAQALDSLQRLLVQSGPDTASAQRPVSAQSLPNAHQNLRNDTNPFAPTPPAPFTTLPMPPSESGRDNSIYLLGFLTGVGLSLMAGAALYLLINIG